MATPMDWSPSTAPGRLAPHFVRAEVDADLVQASCNTVGFEVDGLLVVRRCASFNVRLSTGSKLQPDSVSAVLVYEEGQHEVAMQIEDGRAEYAGYTIQVSAPANTPITMYMLKIKGQFLDRVPFEVELKDRVIVLFNAWSEKDDVYMENEEMRKEYVLNSNGRLFIGDTYGDAWNLALYRADTLRAIIFILETVVKLSFEQKGDPILVTREMSAVVNSIDENGVLEGRWSDTYPDGEFPWFWTGSGAILKQYYQSGGQPVKYGQCWVFSGVLLTVLRVLGIPSRSVTNFNSAHDSNRNRTIDQYYDEDGNKLHYLSSGGDSIWNFHVWNEAWMRRPDLMAGFDGWQAVDATPQEESPQGGGYRTGPSPLKAIKEGNSVGFDTDFIIAEVNADIKKFVIEKDGTPRMFEVDIKTVGKKISTKAVGSNDRVDLTDEYKYPEGTDWERRALYNGYKELLDKIHDVEFFIPETEYEFGEDVSLSVTATSKNKKHHICGSIHCEAVTYTGKVLEDVGKNVVDISVAKGKKQTVDMTVDGEIFTRYTHTKVYLKFIVALAVKGTSQMFSEIVMIAPKPPKLSITGPDELKIGEAGKLLIEYKNTLPVEMKDVTLNIDIEELNVEDVVHHLGSIQPGGDMKYVLDISGVKLGTYTVVASLASDKVEHVTGEKEVRVVRQHPPNSVVPIDVLGIESMDLNVDANRKDHFTNDYEYPGLVVRRGQSFTISITTTKPMPKDSRVVTKAIFQLVANKIVNRVAFEVHALSPVVSGKNIELVLKPPADVSVGEHELILTVDDAGSVSVLHENIKLVILFNPWCSDDSCHFQPASDLSEYVLNTKGKIWVGSADSNYGRPWQFSQFNKDSLEVALWILDHLKAAERADPVAVSRIVSAMTNVQDENGILVGNWSGDYTGGKSPTYWTGSRDIMTQFNATKEPVKFGQCWVFSGLQTTLFRSLGIPARSITNFNSAHDTDFNRAVDRYYNEDGEHLSGADSIWNFHVWNEAWMSRPDLPTGFGGWQALDATPQEQSPQGGGYRLGPAPCKAIKYGIRMSYDVEFVISEVNADIREYVVHPDGTKTLIGVDSTHVGQYISTKAVQSPYTALSVREDVTSNYKFPEDSASERAALLTGTETEVGIALKRELDAMIGDPFILDAVVTNKLTSKRTLNLRLYARAIQYTGAPSQIIRSQRFSDSFAAGESKTFALSVKDADYLRIIQGGNFINFVCLVSDSKGKNHLIKNQYYRLKVPDITITIGKTKLQCYEPVNIVAAFTNTLDKPLTRAAFMLKGDGFMQDEVINVPTIAPRGLAKAVFTASPVKTGSFELVIGFSSRELNDVMGDVDLEVVRNE